LALWLAACGLFSVVLTNRGNVEDQRNMTLFSWSNWPLLFICAAMIASAIIDWWKFKVPNKLTFPIIISGWLLGLAHTFGLQLAANQHGGIGASLAGTAFGLVLLLPAYAIGGMGAGDVKMTMGFGSWAGAFFGLEGGLCLWVIFYAFCAGVIAGGVIGVGMILARRSFGQNIAHARAIMFDLATAGSISAVAGRANERRPRWHRLPYGVPLCIGFVGYLWFAGSQPPPADGWLINRSSIVSIARRAGSPEFSTFQD
jgi:prepilin peptidase CpaA